MARGVAGVEHQGSLELPFRSPPVPLVLVQRRRLRHIGFSEFIISLERLGRCFFGSGKSLIGRGATQIHQDEIGIGDAGIGQSVARVLINRLLEVFQGCRQSLGCPLVPVVAAFEIALMGFRVHPRSAEHPGSFLRCDSNLDFAGDGAGDFGLDRENAFQVAVVALRPQVGLIVDLNELSSDA